MPCKKCQFAEETLAAFQRLKSERIINCHYIDKRDNDDDPWTKRKKIAVFYQKLKEMPSEIEAEFKMTLKEEALPLLNTIQKSLQGFEDYELNKAECESIYSWWNFI